MLLKEWYRAGQRSEAASNKEAKKQRKDCGSVVSSRRRRKKDGVVAKRGRVEEAKVKVKVKQAQDGEGEGSLQPLESRNAKNCSSRAKCAKTEVHQGYGIPYHSTRRTLQHRAAWYLLYSVC